MKGITEQAQGGVGVNMLWAAVKAPPESPSKGWSIIYCALGI